VPIGCMGDESVTSSSKSSKLSCCSLLVCSDCGDADDVTAAAAWVALAPAGVDAGRPTLAADDEAMLRRSDCADTELLHDHNPRITDSRKKLKVKVSIALYRLETHHRATERHLP